MPARSPELAKKLAAAGNSTRGCRRSGENAERRGHRAILCCRRSSNRLRPCIRSSAGRRRSIAGSGGRDRYRRYGGRARTSPGPRDRASTRASIRLRVTLTPAAGTRRRVGDQSETQAGTAVTLADHHVQSLQGANVSRTRHCRVACRYWSRGNAAAAPRRSGPASTWQCRQVWFHSLPTLQRPDGARLPRPEAGGLRRLAGEPQPREHGALLGRGRQRRVTRREGQASGHFRPTCRAQFRGCAPGSVHERDAAADGRRHVHCLGHLLEIGALVERIPAVASMQYGHCTACATASAMSDFSRADSAPSANAAPYQSKTFLPGRARCCRFPKKAGEMRSRVPSLPHPVCRPSSGGGRLSPEP